MKFVNLITCLFVCFFTFGCASTSTQHIVKIEKRPLISDHHLMMSLLNRPITQDQQLMLAFADQQAQYRTGSLFVNTVAILGEKPTKPSTEQSYNRVNNSYTALIASDVNAIRLSGPK